jgi:hypothetical protein
MSDSLSDLDWPGEGFADCQRRIASGTASTPIPGALLYLDSMNGGGFFYPHEALNISSISSAIGLLVPPSVPATVEHSWA